MSTTTKSFSLEQHLAEIVDELPGSNSDVINEALRRFLVTDTEVLEHYIDQAEKKREKKRVKKQELEQEIWELDDKIEDLKDLRTRAKSVEDTRKKIGMERIERVAKVVKTNKYDSDARALTEREVIERHTELIQEDHPDLDEEEIEETLNLFINV